MLLDRHGSGDRAQAERLLEEARMNRGVGMPSYTAEVERMLCQTLDLAGSPLECRPPIRYRLFDRDR